MFLVGRCEYFLKTLITPSYAYGGQPFGVQPSVSITDFAGTTFFNFIGYGIAKIGTAPSMYEQLHFGTCDSTGDCGLLSTNSAASAVFIDGVATFKVNYLKMASIYLVIQHRRIL